MLELKNRLGESRSPYVSSRSGYSLQSRKCSGAMELACAPVMGAPFLLIMMLQVRDHMNNPVAWQNWSAETLTLARTHNRLIFLSIGYAACHCR